MLHIFNKYVRIKLHDNFTIFNNLLHRVILVKNKASK